MTVTDKEVEDLMKALKKELGISCYLVTGKEKEMSKKERDEGK